MNDSAFIVKGILAGVCISLGGCIYLKIGGAIGAILFSFGLIAVITLGLNLFTGKARFVWDTAPDGSWNQGGYPWLIAMLLLNIGGCIIMGMLFSSPAIQEKASAIIIDARLSAPAWKNGLLAIGCGFIMTLSVQSAASKNWLPLLFGIPAFIICGLPHCIADAFYIASLPLDVVWARAADLAAFYGAIVVGNFLGCNLYRLLPSASITTGR